MSRYGFSMGWIPPNDEAVFAAASFEKYQNSSIDFFYRTRRETSMFNSTPFRHALLTNETIRALSGSSSIGLDISKKQWLRDYSNTKYCFVIRGDTPSSRALLRAVKVGCVPIIVSDLLDSYGPSLKSSVSVSDYAITIAENVFLQDPLTAVLQVKNGSSSASRMIPAKLVALAFAQRVVLPYHPESLFVPAVLYEAYQANQRGLNDTVNYPW